MFPAALKPSKWRANLTASSGDKGAISPCAKHLFIHQPAQLSLPHEICLKQFPSHVKQPVSVSPSFAQLPSPVLKSITAHPAEFQLSYLSSLCGWELLEGRLRPWPPAESSTPSLLFSRPALAVKNNSIPKASLSISTKRHMQKNDVHLVLLTKWTITPKRKRQPSLSQITKPQSHEPRLSVLLIYSYK